MKTRGRKQMLSKITIAVKRNGNRKIAKSRRSPTTCTNTGEFLSASPWSREALTEAGQALEVCLTDHLMILRRVSPTWRGACQEVSVPQKEESTHCDSIFRMVTGATLPNAVQRTSRHAVSGSTEHVPG